MNYRKNKMNYRNNPKDLIFDNNRVSQRVQQLLSWVPEATLLIQSLYSETREYTSSNPGTPQFLGPQLTTPIWENL